ncbi:MAG: translation elongation factor Ts [Candidatus Cardinium sp.]|nr:translation elongation factor Ts [Candidatus Cardinium sp.]
MAITAQEVATLRKKTGAGIMDCKKALMEAGGDFEQAIDLLRKKGRKLCMDRAARQASEGAVFAAVSSDQQEAFLLVLNCETDFVARNEQFLQLGNAILAECVAHRPDSIETLLHLPLKDGVVQDAIMEAIGVIGEKIAIYAYETLRGTIVVPYIHTGNTLGVLVALQGANAAQSEAVGKEIAMQIAAMHPVAVDETQVDPALVTRETTVIQEQLAQEGFTGFKAEKITQGRLHKFFQESTLLQQPFVFAQNNKLTVGQYLQSLALTVTAFKRVQVNG